uniref:Evasin n=1 Tax=Rhipicephalus zambeziensis TaxID=60191 RepID=A0A224YE69_9ACAR
MCQTLLALVVIISASTTGHATSQQKPVNRCVTRYLLTDAGPVHIGCSLDCTSPYNPSKLAPGWQCIDTTIEAARLMTEDIKYICNLGICSENGSCAPSRLSIQCWRAAYWSLTN